MDANKTIISSSINIKKSIYKVHTNIWNFSWLFYSQSSVIGQSSCMFQIPCVLGFCYSMFSLYGSTSSNMFSQAQLSSL